MTVTLLQRMTRTTLNVKLRGNCYFWLFMHLLSLWPPSLRVVDRLLETEKSVGTKFCTIFLASRPAASISYYCVRTIDVAIVCLLVGGTVEKGSEDTEELNLRAKLKFKIKELLSMVWRKLVEFLESVRRFGDFEEWKCFCLNFGIWDTVESAI